ncbi:MAG TPA: hypothetical protein VK718_06915 [Ferruginibacter sp.]|jgi:hypothetical protein|nr:hypothetical protein [Ferruginibacter sp.]
MRYISLLAVFAVTILLSHKTYAQKTLSLSTCDDSAIVSQADSVKQDFSNKGFILLKETSVSMETQYEVPIILPLDKGTWYEFVFIGDATSVLYEVRMYDWEEKQLEYQKKNFGDPNFNIIDYSFVPDVSQYYMIKPLQVNKKKKKMCGYVMLFKRTR